MRECRLGDHEESLTEETITHARSSLVTYYFSDVLLVICCYSHPTAKYNVQFKCWYVHNTMLIRRPLHFIQRFNHGSVAITDIYLSINHYHYMRSIFFLSSGPKLKMISGSNCVTFHARIYRTYLICHIFLLLKFYFRYNIETTILNVISRYLFMVTIILRC